MANHDECDSDSCEGSADWSCEGVCGDYCDQCITHCGNCDRLWCENCLPELYPWVDEVNEPIDICKRCNDNLQEAGDELIDIDKDHHPEGYY